ncbi:hypothetical protein JL720_8454 [Aureococcus anophagefferens]|nr:hypothetical protein JL720_8454 [Aureococcus anophagefferens]
MGDIHPVQPPQVEFENALDRLVYVQTISIRNYCGKARRVRIEGPAARGPFTLVFTPGPSLAPGLELTADVQFVLPEDGSGGDRGVFLDRLLVHFGDGEETVEVPLRAVAPQARILAVPSSERPRAGASSHECLELRNLGPVAGDFKLEVGDAAKPATGDDDAHHHRGTTSARQLQALGAKRKTEEEPEDASRDDESGSPRVDTSAVISLELTAAKLGAARFRVVVDTKQGTPCVLDVSCVVVTQRLELYAVSGLRRHEALANVDFGAMFYGQSCERRAVLVNNSPQAVPFAGVRSPRGASADGAKFLDEWETDDGSLTVTPLEGLLEPHARQPVTLRFAPPKPPLTTAFKHRLHAPMQPTDEDADGSPEAGGRVRRNVPSRPYGLKVKVGVPAAGGALGEPDGKAKPDDTEPKRPEIPALEVAVTAHAAPTDAVHVSPKTLRFGTCEPRSKQKGLVTIENASDVAAKFEFAKVAQFSVTPSRGKIAGRAKTTVMVTFYPAQIGNFDVRCELKIEGGLSTQTLRMLGKAVKSTTYPKGTPGSTVGKGSVDVSRLGAGLGALSFEPSVWTDAELLAGVADKKVGQFDYWEERDNQMRADKARSDLNKTQYVKYLQGGGARDRGGQGRGGAPRRAEMRHCSTRLNAADLSKITASHATLDFGRVCVGSKAVKNFAVSNGLSHAVLVAISTASLPPELAAGTTPASQVVPGEATAGFDIALHCAKETLGYRCVVQYTINDRHTLKLAITADVVPVELTLGSPELAIEFDAHSLESSVDATIELKNPGNSAVEFFWTHAPPFSVLPEQGVVPPFGSTEDLELAVTGKLDDAKCAFGERKLDFQTVSVGMERDLAASVLNTGQCAAVCNVEVSPEGDLFDGDYDDDDLLGDDGAGPDIPTLDFADQFVGFEERRRIVLQNESEIGAFLALDLNAFPDFYAEPCKPSDTLHKPPAAPEAAKEEPGAKAKSPAAPSRGVLALEVVFAPKAPGSHEFDLPLELSELQKRPWAHVRAAALRPMLVLSSTTVDFGERIFASDATRQVPFSSDVVLSNHHHGTLQWALDENGQGAPPPPPPPAGAKGGGQPAPPKSAVFFVSPKEGKLQPGESTTVRVTFVPTSSKEYEERFPLSFATEAEAAAKLAGDAVAEKSKPYLTLLLRGSGAHPRLEVEDGSTTATRAGPATFCADAPVSFAAALQLLDSDGNAYTVPIAGAADNCLLSTHAFLAAYKRLRGDGEPRLAGVDPKRERPLPAEDIAPLLVLFLNYHALNGRKGADAPLKSIPEDCVASHGRVAIDAIEALAGRKVPGRLQRVVSNDKELMAQLLLSKHHYIKFREQQADFVSTRAARDARHATWDGTWAAVSLEAWLAVLLQAVASSASRASRPRPSPRSPASSSPSRRAAAGDDHGGSHGSSDPELAGSNVYSVGECVVLKWLGYHAAAGLGNGAGLSKRFDTFGRAFEDPGASARSSRRRPGGGALQDDKPAYVVVESKASAAYTVELAPRSRPAEGRLTFFALPGRRRAAPPSMVFTLRSNVESHAPVAVFEHESTAYEAKNIDVRPPRKPAGNARGGAAGRGRGQPAKRKKQRREAPADWSGHGKGDEFEKAQALLREPFWTSQKTVRLDASGATNLNVQLLSCSPGLYKAELTFLNGDIGEFVVEVLARVHLPKQMDHFKLTVETEDDGQISITKLLRLPPTNPLLERAFAQLGERVPPADDKATKKKPGRASDKAPSEAPGDDDGPSKDEGVAFEVTTDSPFFQCPDELTVVFDAKGADKKGASKASSNKKTELVDVKEDTVIDAPNSLVLSFYPQKAGTYLCAIASQARRASSATSASSTSRSS